jgi:hypothetical protein
MKHYQEYVGLTPFSHQALLSYSHYASAYHRSTLPLRLYGHHAPRNRGPSLENHNISAALPPTSEALPLVHARVCYCYPMLSAEVVFNLCSRRDSTRKALVSLMKRPRCSLNELIKFYQQRAIEDAYKPGVQLQNTVASPAVQQGGSAALSQPDVQKSGPVGAGNKGTVRLKGTPFTAKKRSTKKAIATDRPSVGIVSPIVPTLGPS